MHTILVTDIPAAGKSAVAGAMTERRGIKMKNVIHVYGASGSGTSALGRKISEELGYKFLDTDESSIHCEKKERGTACLDDQMSGKGTME